MNVKSVYVHLLIKKNRSIVSDEKFYQKLTLGLSCTRMSLKFSYACIPHITFPLELMYLWPTTALKSYRG